MSDNRVVVIGAGAGGSAVAHGLTRRGIDVLLIEAGPAYDPHEDYHLHRRDWEATEFPYKPEARGKYRFKVDQPLEEKWARLRSWNRVHGKYNGTNTRQVGGMGYYHVRGLGGSTLRYTGEAHRLNRHAFKMDTRFGVAADWPIEYDDLRPFYEAAETIIGVAGPVGDTDRPGDRSHLQPPHPLSSASRCLQAGANRLDLDWVPNARAALSRARGDRPACNYCGNCNRGCPIRDKGSADVTFLQEARASGRLEIRKLTRVTRLNINADSGRVDRITLRRADGSREELSLDGPMVLAAGAIETPRLLLASHQKTAPNGVANQSGQVGKHFMETLHVSVSGLTSLTLPSYQALPSDSICWTYNRPDAIPGVVGGCRFSSATNEVGLNGPVAYATRAVAGFGTEFKRNLARQFGNAISIGAIGEHLPNADSFVTLDEEARDEAGEPLARIHSKLSETDCERLAFMTDTCHHILTAAGVTEIVEQYSAYDFFSATHVFGTCRMGTSPKKSVVDAHLQTHDHPNLYIADGSVFPSSGGGESPSLTISALALRLAETMATNLTGK